MPHLFHSVLPRLRRSLRERGLFATIADAALLPFQHIRARNRKRELKRTQPRSNFDLAYGVDTDGSFDDWTRLSDLQIASPNRSEGVDYTPIEPERMAKVFAALDIPFEQFVFVDYGSGKGRALLLASEFPFKSIVGLEFSPELHAIAERNLQNYRNPRQRCTNVRSLCIDFLDFAIPDHPAVLFFYDPCSEKLLSRILEKLGKAVEARTADLYLAYVAVGKKEPLLSSAKFLETMLLDANFNFSIHRAKVKSASATVSPVSGSSASIEP